MKSLHRLVIALTALGLVILVAGPVMAIPQAFMEIRIEVFKNGFDQGTASGDSDASTNVPLVVSAFDGDTLRFVVSLWPTQGTPTGVTLVATTLVTVDGNNAAGGANELTFVPGSGVSLGGATFSTLADPNNTLNNASPTSGSANTVGGTGLNLYQVDYVVSHGSADALRDFTVELTSYASSPPADISDIYHDTASVRVDPLFFAPEPASLLLLGSGLAGLVGFGRKKLRK